MKQSFLPGVRKDQARHDDKKRRTSNGTFTPPTQSGDQTTHIASHTPRPEHKHLAMMDRVELRELPSATVISSRLLSFVLSPGPYLPLCNHQH